MTDAAIKALRDLLTADEIAAIDSAIVLTKKTEVNPVPIYITAAPVGNRSLTDVARQIRACVQHIQAVEQACPDQVEYEVALQAEQEAYSRWQGMKSFKGHDPDGTQHMRVIRLKHAYEALKDRRIETGGRIHGTTALVRRMYALIAGEIVGLPQIANQNLKSPKTSIREVI